MNIYSMLDIENKSIKLKTKVTEFLSAIAKAIDVDIKDLSVKVSAELEFYIVKKDNKPLQERLNLNSETIKNLNNMLLTYDDKIKQQENEDSSENIKEKQIRIDNLEEEDGYNQFEVQFKPTKEPSELVKNIINFKNLISKITEVNFMAKPYETEPTSSLHFHISVYYKDANLFSKDNPTNNNEYHYLPLYWCIAGLLETMPKYIKYFAPTKNCIERYALPKENQRYIHYPTRICWGFNNRTCAIRIPRKPNEDPANCRIEHRVSSSAADPFLALFAIFEGMKYGVEKELEAPEPVYVSAFDDENAGKLIIELF